MNNKFKRIAAVSTGAAALALIVTLNARHIERGPAPTPQICPVSGFAQDNRAIPQPITKPTLVGEETTNTNAPTTPPTEIDYVPQKPNDSPAILTPKDAPMDNTTAAPSLSQNTDGSTATEPKMGKGAA